MSDKLKTSYSVKNVVYFATKKSRIFDIYNLYDHIW